MNSDDFFDDQIEGFTEYLRKNVKEEILGELEYLRKENERLKDIERRMAEIEREYAKAVQKAKEEAQHERFAKIMQACAQVYYGVETYELEKAKCDKCNEYRLIPYITPLGRKTTELCTCCEKLVRHKKQPYYVCAILQTDVRIVWHSPCEDDKDRFSGRLIREHEICDDRPFEDLHKYTSYFRSEERCEAFCKWLNEKEIAKEQVKREGKE